MTKETSVFILGKREHGIVCITMEPFKTIFISPEEIEAYDAKTGGDGFAEAAAGLVDFSKLKSSEVTQDSTADLKAAIAESVIRNEGLSNADFTYVGTCPVTENVGFNRYFADPSDLKISKYSGPENVQIAAGQMEEFIKNDKATYLN